MKKGILLIYILLSFFASFGQRKVLNVPLFPQLTDSWCWAASIQMVAGYNRTPSPRDSQKHLGVLYYNMKVPEWKGKVFVSRSYSILATSVVPISDADISFLFQSCATISPYSCDTSPSGRAKCLGSFFNPKAKYNNNKISIYRTTGDPKDFSSIFSQIGFNSLQFVTTSSWFDVIRGQIDSCKPVIILIGPPSSPNGHVVVGVGYKILVLV